MGISGNIPTQRFGCTSETVALDLYSLNQLRDQIHCFVSRLLSPTSARVGKLIQQRLQLRRDAAQLFTVNRR
jgi:hypothetical protein